jgi:hypothetical protein
MFLLRLLGLVPLTQLELNKPFGLFRVDFVGSPVHARPSFRVIDGYGKIVVRSFVPR